jgi:hypothetical protein
VTAAGIGNRIIPGAGQRFITDGGSVMIIVVGYGVPAAHGGQLG